ncbi:hypothetical protein D7V97_00865 [Corallococcus sp. CA053C]|nr:hypothetical protein D7V97_00865 [Corallococcus sp. CA053C]
MDAMGEGVPQCPRSGKIRLPTRVGPEETSAWVVNHGSQGPFQKLPAELLSRLEDLPLRSRITVHALGRVVVHGAALDVDSARIVVFRSPGRH